MSRPLRKQIFRIIVVLLGLCFAFDLVTHLIVEILWFQEVNYLANLQKRLLSQFVLWAIACSSSIFFLLGNLLLTQRFKWRLVSSAQINSQPLRQKISSSSLSSGGRVQKDFLVRDKDKPKLLPESLAITLRPLLLIVLGLCFVMGVMLFHYSEVALHVWNQDLTLPHLAPPLPSLFKIISLQAIVPQISENFWRLGLVVGVIILLLFNPEFWLTTIAIGMSCLFGVVISGNWTRILESLSPTTFNQLDPQFGRDISFYVFRLPLWQLLDFWLGGLFLYSLIAVSFIYLLSGNSISRGKFPGFSRPQLRHMYILGGVVMLALGLHHWLTRYELLYSLRGITYGASYTDVKIQLVAETGLGLISVAIAFWLLFKKAIFGGKPKTVKSKIKKINSAIVLISLYLTIVAIGVFLTIVVQRLAVQPNELARERTYIERSIKFTRNAFDLDKIEARTFDPEGKLTSADLQKNNLTIDNIRLWDTRPLLQTNRQLQQIRLYYKFPDADIDRYNLKKEEIALTNDTNSSSPTKIFKTEKQQVIIASRELDYSAVPEQAKTWINEHLVYTHGYGFTISPVNQVGEGGLPDYFVKDIGTGARRNSSEEATLYTSNPLIRDSIPINRPRIYYGELTNTYIMTSTKVKELDFPSGEENVYNTYDGTGGIRIGSWGRRLLFAQYLKDWRMLFTENFTPDTKLLFRRNLNRRVREIAPFLRYDRNPYLVVADGNETNELGDKNYLYWIIDAYTTSDRYPYSDPGKHAFNYIRNSVKVVVNAYNGNVDFYIADPQDPIIQTWSQIFPKLFKPLDAMPVTLRSHIRYPSDLFSIQSERLLTYHMTDPQVFYNREDQWEIPQEIYGEKSQPIKPYYLIMKLPTATTEEFILLHPYTPTSRPNLIAWLAGRSDGQQYGKLLLYQFPKQKLIYGPDQVEALINQDPVISQQISLWNRQGSRAIQGNLLVIPIEQSLLYVEPLYLEAEKNSLPILARVIVVYENRIIMAKTLEEALADIFKPDSDSSDFPS